MLIIQTKMDFNFKYTGPGPNQTEMLQNIKQTKNEAIARPRTRSFNHKSV